MADFRQNYGATGAPLTVGNLVVSGVSGGDEGVRGFIAALRPGHAARRCGGSGPCRAAASPAPRRGRATRSITRAAPRGSPAPTIPSSACCTGRSAIRAPTSSATTAAATTSTRARSSPSMPRPARLKWHFQFTPHDVWDFDAQQTPALIDTVWRGQPRKLLVHANRNGFLYVLDRTTGRFLSGTQYVREPDLGHRSHARRPADRRAPNQERHAEGRRICPHVNGASNWYSTAFNPATGLYYVQTNEWCSVLTRTPMPWEAGKGFMGGSFRVAAEQTRAASESCGRSTSRPAAPCGKCHRPAGATRGAARSAPPAASCSSARTAARSWRWTPRAAASCGSFPRTSSGPRRR